MGKKLYTKEQRLSLREEVLARYTGMPPATRIDEPVGDLTAVFYTNTRKEPALIVWAGTQSRPIIHYRFGNEALRQECWESTKKMYADREAARGERKRKAGEFAKALKPGDILVSAWGYDQTNIDFYQVISVKGKKVVICRIAKKTSQVVGWCSEMVVPIPNQFVGEFETHYVRDSESIKLTDFSWAHPWDGKPENETSYH